METADIEELETDSEAVVTNESQPEELYWKDEIRCLADEHEHLLYYKEGNGSKTRKKLR